MSTAIKREKSFTSLIPPKPSKAKKKAMSEPDFMERGPTLYISGMKVPELDRQKVGSTFEATVKCKVVSVSQREREGGKPRRSYDLEVMGISLD